jgi:hypothetical protein
MILIYTPKITKRVNYVFKLIFAEILGTEYELTSIAEKFLAYDGAKFSYAPVPFGKELFFQSAGLLFQTGIEGQNLSMITYEKNKCFYQVFHNQSVMPFDPFSASFYLVTRYEEYLPFIKDEFGRFEAAQSVAMQNGFLRKPVVNIWIEKIKSLLAENFPDLKFKERTFKFIPTIDIDTAYAYKHKGTVRTTGGILAAMMKLDFPEILERMMVLAGLQKDPYDTYNQMLQLQKKYNLYPLYFILIGDYGDYDKNIPANSRNFQTLVKSLGDYAEVGIHPSFDTVEKPEKLKIEVERLSRILNREITKSRQHFLRLAFPSSYRNLINLDITDDYTMGYASSPGFRAGICDPFYFYDLDLETATNLRVHPFQVMEGTLKDYLQKDTDQSLDIIKMLIDEVKNVKGTFISLWHNESLSNAKRWKGWNEVYAEMIKYACR